MSRFTGGNLAYPKYADPAYGEYITCHKGFERKIGYGKRVPKFLTKDNSRAG